MVVADKTLIRLAELGCGCFALWIRACYCLDTVLILIVCALWGIPLDIIIERREKK